MRFQLKINAWNGPELVVYFNDYRDVWRTAWGLLRSSAPMNVAIFEHIEGQGYKREKLNRSNEGSV